MEIPKIFKKIESEQNIASINEIIDLLKDKGYTVDQSLELLDLTAKVIRHNVSHQKLLSLQDI